MSHSLHTTFPESELDQLVEDVRIVTNAHDMSRALYRLQTAYIDHSMSFPRISTLYHDAVSDTLESAQERVDESRYSGLAQQIRRSRAMLSAVASSVTAIHGEDEE